MRLVIQVAARDVIPYLADAVPGWFQAVVRITDDAGEDVSSADSHYFHQDPVLYFEVPRDGRYTIEIRDSLFRGREDFVYRMTVGETPFITSVFPLGARVNSELSVQLRGWNLTQTEQNVQTMSRDQYRPVRWYSAIQGDHSVRFPLQIDHWPEQFEQATNDDRQTAQKISTRMTVNGKIEEPGDKDVYLIKGGTRFVAEIHARRLGSPLDSTLTLRDADGNEIAFNDDHIDKSQSMLTHHADSHLSASLASKGDYYLTVADAQNKGGPDFGYRLCMRSPQADYELRVVPSNIIARPGQVVPITVFAMRHDGFDQDIDLSLVEPPPGFQLNGGVIPGESDQMQMTLTLPERTPEEVVTLAMEGRANRRLRSRSTIVRPAIPAENMMQAFIWYHLVPVENWNVVVSGKPATKMPLRFVMPDEKLSLPLYGKFRVSLLPVSKNVSLDQLQVDLIEPGKGISASIVSDSISATVIEFDISPDAFQPGFRGNLLVSVYREYTPEPTEKEPEPRARRTDYGFLPAIPFEISKATIINEIAPAAVVYTSFDSVFIWRTREPLPGEYHPRVPQALFYLFRVFVFMRFIPFSRSALFAVLLPAVLLATFVYTPPSPLWGQDGGSLNTEAASIRELVADLEYLASDDLKGRSAADQSIQIAADYLVNRMSEIGLEMDEIDGDSLQEVQVFLGLDRLSPERTRLSLRGTIRRRKLHPHDSAMG